MGKEDHPSNETSPNISGSEVVFRGDFLVLSGRANTALARSVGLILQKEVLQPISSFADGEVRVQIPENVRRRDIFIIQPTSPPAVNDNIMELLLMIDAAKRASAGEITAIIPYFGYARQDRKEMSRVPISASLVAKMIEQSGVARIVTIDIHSEQQAGYVQIPWDNLYGSYSLIPAIESRNLVNLKVVSPDKGGVPRATAYARRLEAAGVAIVYKERDVLVNDISRALVLEGDVEGNDVLIVDDIIDTAGTITHAAELLKSRGARKIMVATTHGVFSGLALETINKSAIDEIIITDTIQHRPEVESHPKVRIVSVAPMLAGAVCRIHTGESLTDLIL